MKSCASCRHWIATEILFVPIVDIQPHQQRQFDADTEAMRSTLALCSWPSTPAAEEFFRNSPPWMQRSHAAGGTITSEDDGADCPCWEQRPDVWTPSASAG